MTVEQFDSPEDRQREEEAARWVAKRVGGFSPSDQDAYFQWLASDPRNGERFAEQWQMWKKLDRLAEWRPEHSNRPNQDLLKVRRRARASRWFRWGGMAALAAMALGIGWYAVEENSRDGQSDRYADENGRISRTLADGTVVDLNGGAELVVLYSETERRVELLTNEAHFDVTKDPNRPFIVSVQGLEVRAVGTAFNVRLGSGEVEVLVTEGEVQLASTAAESDAATEDHASALEVVGNVIAGQLSRINLSEMGAAMKVVEPSYAELNQLLSWKPLYLNFDSTPLEEVIEAFNSRNETQCIIEDPSLASVPIVASFRSAKVEHFIELLELTIPIRVERREDGHISLFAQSR